MKYLWTFKADAGMNEYATDYLIKVVEEEREKAVLKARILEKDRQLVLLEVKEIYEK